MLNTLKPNIEFYTSEKNFGVIPEPYSAVQFLQGWYKKLPHRHGNKGLHTGTVKRCAPFLDAMGVGYIIPLAADVEIDVLKNGNEANTQSNFHLKMIGQHSAFQLGEDHPTNPSPVLKFSNYWAIKVPNGWSVLFTPPLNRPDPRFECFSGVVECDKYFNYINFPFFLKDLNFSGIISQGTPIIQAIPFKRGAHPHNPMIRKLKKSEEDRISKTVDRINAHESYYRDEIWSLSKRFFNGATSKILSTLRKF